VQQTTEKARELGGTMVTDLVSADKSSWKFYTLVLWLNEIEVSGNVSKERTGP
jgi:hypothetical protein